MLPGDDIGHQRFLARVIFPCHDDRLAHSCVLAQHRLDLAWLNAETTDLYLIVQASEEFEVAVGEPAHAVAGLVQAGTRPSVEWMGKESFRRQLRPVQIAAGEAAPPI